MKNISHPLDTVFSPSRQELGPIDLPHSKQEAEKVQNKVTIPQRVIYLSCTVYLSALAVSKTLAVISLYLPPNTRGGGGEREGAHLCHVCKGRGRVRRRGESGMRAFPMGQFVLPKEQGSPIPLTLKLKEAGVGDACLVQGGPANCEL